MTLGSFASNAAHGMLSSFPATSSSGASPMNFSGWRHCSKNYGDNFGNLNGANALDPILLAVPGNHDLQRPAASAELRVLKALAGSDDNPEEVWDGLIREPDSSYRKLLDRAFKAYSEWWNRCPFRGETRSDFQISSGPLPGDFRAALQKDAACLGGGKNSPLTSNRSSKSIQCLEVRTRPVL